MRDKEKCYLCDATEDEAELVLEWQTMPLPDAPRYKRWICMDCEDTRYDDSSK